MQLPLRAEKGGVLLSMCEAPSTSVLWGSIPKGKDQPTPFTNAPADDNVPSHQEFHHKLLQETAQQSCTKHLTEF